MYRRAKKILASEIMYVLEKTEKGAEEYLDEFLARTREHSIVHVSGGPAEYTVERTVESEPRIPPLSQPPELLETAGDMPSASAASDTRPADATRHPEDDSPILGAEDAPGASGREAAADQDARRDESAERFWSLLARSRELGGSIEADLASLTLIGRDPRSSELAGAVRSEIGVIQRRAEAKSELARLIRAHRSV